MRGFEGSWVRRIVFPAATAFLAVVLIFSIAGLNRTTTFKLDLIAHGRLFDGGGLVVDVFTSSKGVKLWFSRSGYASPEKANEVYDDTLRRASSLIEMTPKFNHLGLKVGKRAVARLVNPENCEQYASVFWTDGRILYSIDSLSMEDVLQFEQYRNDD